MGATIAEKILGAHAGERSVKGGEVVVASVDFAMLHDARATNALERIEQLGAATASATRCCPRAGTSLAATWWPAPTRIRRPTGRSTPLAPVSRAPISRR